MTRDEINARLEELRDGIAYLAAFDELDADQRAQWDDGTAEFEALTARAQDIAERNAAADRAAKVPTLQVITRHSTEDVLNDRGASPQALTDTVTRAMEDRGVDADGLANVRSLMIRHQDDVRSGGPAWARNLAVRSTVDYGTGWSKVMTGRGEFLSSEERAALSVGTNADGGFLVPTHLDPTLIITNTGGTDVVRTIARKVTTIGQANVWNGVTSAGSSFSFDGELAEVSDDSPSFGRVSIAVHRAQGFVQASVEMLEDSNITADLGGIFADGRDRLEATAHVTGSGSGQPTGIVVALDANTNVEIAVTTAATLGLVDIDAVYRAVGLRWRSRGQWLYNPFIGGKIRALATTAGLAYETVNLTQGNTTVMYNKPVNETDEMSATALTGNGTNALVYGDFENYVIVDKPGSFALTYVPVMFNTTSNRPDGRVGWYAYWRTGADSVNDVAFRVLQNKT